MVENESNLKTSNIPKEGNVFNWPGTVEYNFREIRRGLLSEKNFAAWLRNEGDLVLAEYDKRKANPSFDTISDDFPKEIVPERKSAFSVTRDNGQSLDIELKRPSKIGNGADETTATFFYLNRELNKITVITEGTSSWSPEEGIEAELRQEKLTLFFEGENPIRYESSYYKEQNGLLRSS